MASDAPLALDIRGLSKTYGNGLEALKNVSLAVEPGEFFALLGPNGAGKSTLIGIVASLVNKTAGTVRVFGRDLDTDKRVVKSFIGIVPQEINFNMFESPIDIVVHQAGYYGIERAEARRRAVVSLERLGLGGKLDLRARQLSGGMKRRLMIARAIVHEPKLLILDEPTAGVDIELRRSMWEYLREINRAGTTIILTTHYLEEAETLCEKLAIIDRGQVVEDTNMKDLLNKLHVETFVFDLDRPLDEIPVVEGYTLRRVDPTTVEADVHKGQGVNGLFEAFTRGGLTVSSMRNKTNRLEELFLDLVERTDPLTPEVGSLAPPKVTDKAPPKATP